MKLFWQFCGVLNQIYENEDFDFSWFFLNKHTFIFLCLISKRKEKCPKRRPRFASVGPLSVLSDLPLRWESACVTMQSTLLEFAIRIESGSSVFPHQCPCPNPSHSSLQDIQLFFSISLSVYLNFGEDTKAQGWLYKLFHVFRVIKHSSFGIDCRKMCLSLRATDRFFTRDAQTSRL